MWINPTTHQVFRTHSEIRQDCPNVSFPANITEQMIVDHGYVPVVQVAPNYNPHTQAASELPPALVDDVWTQQWAVTDLAPEVIAANLVAQRAMLWTEIKAIRDLKIQTGGYQASGKWFHSDTFSRTQQMALVMMGASVPPVAWKTMDGSFVTMTQALAGAIFQSGAAHDTATFGYAEALKARVDAASDPATVDINAGWPAVFA